MNQALHHHQPTQPTMPTAALYKALLEANVSEATAQKAVDGLAMAGNGSARDEIVNLRAGLENAATKVDVAQLRAIMEAGIEHLKDRIARLENGMSEFATKSDLARVESGMSDLADKADLARVESELKAAISKLEDAVGELQVGMAKFATADAVAEINVNMAKFATKDDLAETNVKLARVEANMATKDDLTEVRGEVTKLRDDMRVWSMALTGIVVGSLTLIFTIITFIDRYLPPAP